MSKRNKKNICFAAVIGFLLFTIFSIVKYHDTLKENLYNEGFIAGIKEAAKEENEIVIEQNKESIEYDTEKVSYHTKNSIKIADETAISIDEDDVLPDGFVVLNEYLPDAFYEIRYYTSFNFVGERIDGYEEPIAIISLEAANRLKDISEEIIEDGYKLKIYDAYRPKRAVDHFVSWANDVNAVEMKEYFYPDLDKSVLFRTGYIAKKSGHSRGSTVDLTLFDMKRGCDVDMGSGFDLFSEKSSPSYTAGLTKEQIANRKYLRNVMTKHGFKGIGSEWWHYTLKDEPFLDEYFDFTVKRYRE